MVATARIERLSSIQLIPPSLAAFPLLEGHPCGSRAAVERGSSQGAFREHKTNVGGLPILLSWGLYEHRD